ncbi:phage holin family protein [Winogradskyella sp.]|uniref:phage holin family protein n=1 Tax=Winogradskyella sp. TaxID=1883156 RepID=UPI003BA8EC72
MTYYLNTRLQDILQAIGKYYNEIKAFIYSLFIYLEMDVDVVKILFYLMVIDTVLGVVKSLKLGYKFSMKKLGYGFISKLCVLLVPMTLAFIGKGLSYDFKWFVNVVMDILIVSDGISIFSNVLTIKTGKEVKNIDIMTSLISLIRKYFINVLEALFNSIKNENSKNS